MVSGDLTALLIPLMAGVTIMAVIFAVAYPYISGGRQTEKRVASVTDTRIKKTGNARSAADVAANRKKQVSDSLRNIEARQKAKERITLRTRLERAGFEPDPQTVLDCELHLRTGLRWTDHVVHAQFTHDAHGRARGRVHWNTWPSTLLFVEKNRQASEEVRE